MTLIIQHGIQIHFSTRWPCRCSDKWVLLLWVCPGYDGGGPNGILNPGCWTKCADPICPGGMWPGGKAHGSENEIKYS